MFGLQITTASERVFMKINNIKVGIPIIGSKEWLGGIAYIELLIRAVASLKDNERPKLFLIVRDGSLKAFELHKHILSLLDGVIYIGTDPTTATKTIATDFVHYDSYDELHKNIDVYFPVTMDVYPHRCSVSWIPDFQHKYLPEFFSEQEIVNREEKFLQIAHEARLITFSSNSARQDFQKFYPESKAVTKILSFFSYPQEEWYAGDCIQVQERYRLPDNFILCCNQMWAHKNYERLFEAIALLRRDGQEIHLVCTGSKIDSRFSGYYEKIINLIQELDISNQIHLLGMIPRNDQIQLIRRSLMIVQPSLFEGWSTVVEDCRVLGKTMLLSDLDVNIEQNPEYSIYFNRVDASDLALKMKAVLKTTKPGPDLAREAEAKGKALDFVNQYARQFCNIVSATKELWT